MAYQNIIVETLDKVGLVRLNRPEAMNALSTALVGELDLALETFERDRGIGCIVVTGSEKAFAAGADIKEMQAKTYPDVYLENFLANWDRVASARKPIIAAVSGFALGGGCELAMICDFIIASDTAKFGQPEIKLGVMPGAGGTQRLARFVGKSKAMDMCLTGRMIDAQEAERCGLVSRVVPGQRLLEEALQAAATIASHVVAGRHGDQGKRQPRLRDLARRRSAVRAASVPGDVCDQGSEGRHGCLPRKARG